MKKICSMFLLLFCSLLLCSNVNAKEDITSSLESTFTFDNVVAKKVATVDNAQNNIGYLVTLAYPNGNGTYTVKKQVLYIYKSKKELINKDKVIYITSKFGSTRDFYINDVVYDNNDNNNYNSFSFLRDAYTSSNREMLNDFFRDFNYLYNNPNEINGNKNNFCSSIFFVEPMYNNTEEYDKNFISNLSNSYILSNQCSDSTHFSYSYCNNKSCLESSCDNSTFNNRCSTQCKKYKKYLEISNNTDQNITYSTKKASTLGSFMGALKYFNFPTISQGNKENASSLSTGWGFSDIVPLMSVIDYIDFSYQAKQYCYYNVAVCENGEAMGECIKENESGYTSKQWICPDGTTPKPDNNNLCYVDVNAVVEYWCPRDSELEGDKCVTYGKEVYYCDDECADGDEDCFNYEYGVVDNPDTVCTEVISEKAKCPSGTTKTRGKDKNGKTADVCVAKNKKPFSCATGQKLVCVTGKTATGKKVPECHCEYTTSTPNYKYKLQYLSGGVCNKDNYAGGGGCNNSNFQSDCSPAGCNNQCNDHLKCAKILTGYTRQTHYVKPTCTAGFVEAGGVDHNVNSNIRCKHWMISEETESYEYPKLKYSCYNGIQNTPICNIYDATAWYTCPEDSVSANDEGSICRYTRNKVFKCARGSETGESGDRACKYYNSLEDASEICNNSTYCNPVCPNNQNIQLNDCIKEARKSGITINERKYNPSTYAQAYLYCRLRYCGEKSTCEKENVALQTETVDIVSCILEKADELKKDIDGSKLAQVRTECEKRLCPKKCFTPDSISGNNPSCSGKYDESQTVIYNELETKEETNLTICNNQSPRVSKYGRFIAQNGNCKLYCRQKESKIDLPTNILTPMWRLSYFEWPTRNIGNHLKIETTNLCYIFTDKINGDASNCSFTESTIIDEIKKKDNATIKLQNNVTLSSTVKGAKTSGNIVYNKNVNNPESFEIKTTAEYKIPANSNNILSVKKSNKTLTKNLGYGTIQISKDETLGQHDLKLTVSNYGFNNQFGVKVNGYTCHYNVSKNPSITTVCKITECKGNLIINNNYRNYNNKVKAKSYTNKENKVCKLEYTCGSKAGMENALESCVMSYYTDNDWVYDVALIDTTKLDSALKHCSSICNNDIEQVVFRKISISEPFPGISGKGRVSGTNWIGFEDIAENNDKTKPIYEIALTSSNIKNIRNYNKNNDYDDWKLNTNGLSSFIRNTSYVKILNYNKPTSTSTTKKCVKIVTPPQPVILWKEYLKSPRKDGNGYKRLILSANIVEPTGKKLNLESVKTCTTTSTTCTPTSPVLVIDNHIWPYPELSSNALPQRICAIAKDKGGKESEVTCSGAYLVNTEPELDVIFSTTSTQTNGWYKNLDVKASLNDDNNTNLKIVSAKYCRTTNEKCTPNIIVNPSKPNFININSFSSNSEAQNVCVYFKADNGKTIEECSGKIYKFDNKKPSAPSITNPSKEVCVAGPITLTVSSSDSASGIAYYQYTYNENASNTGSDNSVDWVTHPNSGVSPYNPSAYVAQRNQYTYIRACDKAGNCSDKSKTYIRIGTAKKSDTLCYTSVQAAINDGTNGTVTMLRDSTENVSIASNKSLIIDMNGKTLNGSLTNNGSIWIQGNGKINTSGTAINNNGSLTVKNGTFGISTTGTNAGLINSGNCLIESGTFRAINTIQNRKTMTIKDGTFQARDTAIWQTESGTALWMYGGNITSANIFAIYNQSNHAIVAYNVNAIEKTNQGYIIRINKLSSNTYNVAVFGSSITSCPSWPTNSNNPHWYDALTHSDGQGTYKYCRIYSSDYSNPNNTWNTHLYNNGSKTAELNGWTWK